MTLFVEAGRQRKAAAAGGEVSSLTPIPFTRSPKIRVASSAPPSGALVVSQFQDPAVPSHPSYI